MPTYFELLLLVLPVFALIGVGVAVRRVHWIEGDAETSLIRLVVNVCYPCLIFESVAGNTALRSPGNLLLPPLIGFGVTWLGIRAGLLVAGWIGLHVGSGLRTFALAVGIANYGYLPLPIMEAIWGPESRGVLLVHNVGVEAAIWTVGVLVLSGQSLREGWRKLVSPIMITLGLAVVSNLSGFTALLPTVVTATIHALAVCAIPLGLIMTGVNLAQYLHEPRTLFDRKVSVAAMALRLGVLPVLILLLAKFLPCPVELKRVLIVQAAMPTAVIPIIIAKLYGGHPRTAVQIVLGTTALGIFVIPPLAPRRNGLGVGELRVEVPSTAEVIRRSSFRVVGVFRGSPRSRSIRLSHSVGNNCSPSKFAVLDRAHAKVASGGRIPNRFLATMSIAIIGLGYVGLPLSLQFARKGITVVGLDIDQAKVDAIRRKESYIKHISSGDIAGPVDAGQFRASTDFSEVSQVDAVVICVPTPLNKYREPDISYVLDTGRAIAPHLQKGTLVVLESTTYPGTTEDELRAVLEGGSGLKAGTDFHLAFSPEREDPGNPDSKVASIPKVVGGYTPACLEKAVALYRQALATVVPVSSCRVAEATKLLENIFRSVNIALVNELKVVYAAMGIDIWEVIAAAKTKPFGFMPFYPGPGLGGHCIPIDPFYLTWKAREYGQHTRFIELAGEINTTMPDYVVGRVAEALNDQGKPLKGSRILLLGLAYKANVDDDRESPSYVLIEKLEAKGAIVEYHDPFVPVIRLTREHSHFAGRKSVILPAGQIPASTGHDLILISTAHDAYRALDFSRFTGPVVDTRNCVATLPRHYYRA